MKSPARGWNPPGAVVSEDCDGLPRAETANARAADDGLMDDEDGAPAGIAWLSLITRSVPGNNKKSDVKKKKEYNEKQTSHTKLLIGLNKLCLFFCFHLSSLLPSSCNRTSIL